MKRLMEGIGYELRRYRRDRIIETRGERGGMEGMRRMKGKRGRRD